MAPICHVLIQTIWKTERKVLILLLIVFLEWCIKYQLKLWDKNWRVTNLQLEVPFTKEWATHLMLWAFSASQVWIPDPALVFKICRIEWLHNFRKPNTWGLETYRSLNMCVSSSDLLSNHADTLVNFDFHCGLNDYASSHSYLET